jgi:formylmethanofuran dehydrogenase subunit E
MTEQAGKRTARPRLMRCAYCGEKKPWPDAFPVRIEAVCYQCLPGARRSQ